MRVSQRSVLTGICVLLTCFSGQAAAKKAPTPKTVDAGSFGVYVNGQRVATERFEIQQQEDGSVATSELQTENTGENMKQKARLQIAPDGALRRYEWHELSPGKAEDVVEPSEQFLVEHITPEPPAKPQDQPFLMPISTAILDDYFFSQREILVWRYLAEGCGGTITPTCKLSKTQYGVVIPRQVTSATISLEYAGTEQVTIRGTVHTLSRINLTTDTEEWVLYLDQNLKLQRIVIPGQNTEILRD